MPKFIELTVEILIQKVSCPGVWLCQDGRVSLTVFALGTSFQTCLLPPVFPLVYKDIFFFRKLFTETCALNNICCLLKDETIYCELVQWRDDCVLSECGILAQYLGALCDILFPPNLCSHDGVDLLMRRAPDFPGILSPKIEIATKVRIDEIWNPPPTKPLSNKTSHCPPCDDYRPKQSCHSTLFHRTKCHKSPYRQSQARSEGSQSASSFLPDHHNREQIVNRLGALFGSRRARARDRERDKCYNVYNVTQDVTFRGDKLYYDDSDPCDDERFSHYNLSDNSESEESHTQKLLLESRYIDNQMNKDRKKRVNKYKHVTPCVCEICKKYHELFHEGIYS